VAEWAVEVLNDLVEAELLSLPKDMQARFLRIAELLESFGPQRVGLPHVRPLGEKLWEMRLSGRKESDARFTQLQRDGGWSCCMHL
jgi:hypothetical protein